MRSKTRQMEECLLQGPGRDSSGSESSTEIALRKAPRLQINVSFPNCEEFVKGAGAPVVIVSRGQSWQAASSSSPSSLRKLQVPTFYPCPPKGAMFMVQLVGTTFNSVFLNFPFVLLIFYLPFSPISSFPPLCLVSFLIYLLSFHMPFLPPSSQWGPSMLSSNLVEASGTIFSFSFLQVLLLCYSLQVQLFFLYYLPFFKYFFFPHCLWPRISWLRKNLHVSGVLIFISGD